MVICLATGQPRPDLIPGPGCTAREEKCHSNWQFLSTLAEHLPDSSTKQALQAAVQQVETQEDEHLNWARTTWQQAVLAQLTQQ